MIQIDIDMPSQCARCEFSGVLDNSHTFCTRFPTYDKIEFGEPRPEWCPLKEVKHGKWIMGREKILWDETDDGPVYMYSTTWTCSECGYRRFLTSCPDDKFCKECGTKMDL